MYIINILKYLQPGCSVVVSDWNAMDTGSIPNRSSYYIIKLFLFPQFSKIKRDVELRNMY